VDQQASWSLNNFAIRDGQANVIYQIDTKAFSLHSKFQILDNSNTVVANSSSPAISLTAHFNTQFDLNTGNPQSALIKRTATDEFVAVVTGGGSYSDFDIHWNNQLFKCYLNWGSFKYHIADSKGNQVSTGKVANGIFSSYVRLGKIFNANQYEISTNTQVFPVELTMLVFAAQEYLMS
jgi:hypothetical protein